MYSFKQLAHKIPRSSFPISDIWSLFVSYFLHPPGIKVSNSYRYNIDGKITANSLSIGLFSNSLGLNIAAKGRFSLASGATANFGENVRIARGCNFLINKSLSIGDNTYVQANTQILANAGVSIGSDCALSWNLQIIDDDMHEISINGHSKGRSERISIGNRVWIGCNCIILKGTLIGNNVVVAAGSVVKGTFPDNCLIGGVPAKVLRDNISWE